jgi:hypothetical protein
MTNTKIETSTIKPEVSFFQDESIHRIINLEDEVKLDNHITSMRSYMSSTNGFGKTEEQKDMDYSFVQNLWKNYRNDLQSTTFNFYLNRPQYTLLTDILLKKLEYDVDSLFIAIDLSDLLKSMSGAKYLNDNELKFFKATATETTFIYHLIKNFKVKGLSKDAFTFAEVVKRIADISKIVSYYDSNAKNLTEEIGKWALSLDGSENLVLEIPDKKNDLETEDSKI